MTTNFIYKKDTQSWPAGVDLDDIYIRSDFFQQGNLWGSGDDSNYSLGDDTTILNKSLPVQVMGTGTNWKQVSGGWRFNLANKSDGSLWAWGNNSSGQLGDGTIAVKSTITQISSNNIWKQLSCGSLHTLCIQSDGSLWSWGGNGSGQLGNNLDTTNRSSPIQIGTTKDWKYVYGGSEHSLAVKTDGTVWSWGHAGAGQLGEGSNNPSLTNKSSPIQIAGSDWKSVHTNSASYFTVGIKTDGTLWSWGSNNFGQLADNSTTNKSSPVQEVLSGTNWKQVSAGGYHTAAIKTNGELWTWGANNFGQLGTNGSNTSHKSSPVQTISGGTNWRVVMSGNRETCVIQNDNSLWGFGLNISGQLGNTGNTNVFSPVTVFGSVPNIAKVFPVYDATFVLTLSD